MIELTEAAAKQISQMHQEQNQGPETGIRFFITEGGCSGFEYGMKFDQPKDDDQTAQYNSLTVIIDPKSLQRLKGVRIHFDDGLHGKGFEFTNPNASSTCGCGKSFS